MSIKCKSFLNFNASKVPSPCFVVDEVALENNLALLAKVQEQSGAKILMALKAFSMFHFAPLISKYLCGTCASGLHEAKLGKEEFGGEVHCFSAAYSPHDIDEILEISDHVVFNSFNQWQRFAPKVQQALKKQPNKQFGLRVNPRHSEGAAEIYDPCAKGSRLGIISDQFVDQDLTGISGLHFHTLCEQGFEPLERTLQAVEKQFGHILPSMKWVNFGGGHHITADGYNVDGLIDAIKAFQQKYDVQVYLEPGEAIAIHTGVLVSEVLDTGFNAINTAILDTSATCHMPDTIEMPYRADIFNAGHANEKNHTYRLGGQTCLAGDVMGDYSFDQPLQVGQRLMFDDMSHYTMVKTTTFNGIGLPSLAKWNSKTGNITVIKQFGYDDFKSRLS